MYLAMGFACFLLDPLISDAKYEFTFLANQPNILNMVKAGATSKPKPNALFFESAVGGLLAFLKTTQSIEHASLTCYEGIKHVWTAQKSLQ